MTAQACTLVAAAFARRTGAGLHLADHAQAVTSAAHAMAVRFHQGGKLVAFGVGGASTDAQHVAVEFVHPVIVGKRALWELVHVFLEQPAVLAQGVQA